jgi:hypothetical protein
MVIIVPGNREVAGRFGVIGTRFNSSFDIVAIPKFFAVIKQDNTTLQKCQRSRELCDLVVVLSVTEGAPLAREVVTAEEENGRMVSQLRLGRVHFALEDGRIQFLKVAEQEVHRQLDLVTILPVNRSKILDGLLG